MLQAEPRERGTGRAGEADGPGEFGRTPSDAPRRSSGRVWVIGIVLAGLLAGGGYFALNRPGRAQPAASPSPPAAPVVTLPPPTRDPPFYPSALGPVPARDKVRRRTRPAAH